MGKAAVRIMQCEFLSGLPPFMLLISAKFIMKISGNPRAVDSLLYQTPTLAFKDYALNPISGMTFIQDNMEALNIYLCRRFPTASACKFQA